MSFELSDSDRAFRDELRGFLDAHLTPQPIDKTAHKVWQKKWHQALVEHRWAVPAWPPQYGGRDATTTQQILFAQVMGERDAPVPSNAIALFNIGPMLLSSGTAAQQSRYLPKMVTAEEIWCQGFSEPNAGSDLAGLETQAIDGGDHFVVNGQKIWTTYGPDAHFCLALVRTDAKVAKHKGLSALIIDMHAPGVEVKPLREITGDGGFSEIFLTDVRVPKENLVGVLNGGWAIAMSTLKHERLGTLKLAAQLKKNLDSVVTLARELGKIEEPWVRQALAALGVRVDLIRLLTERALEAIQRDEDPGATLPLGKLEWSYLMQELAELALKIAGPRAQFYRSKYEISGNWPYHCLYARSMTIAAGTTQVQKNILAARCLGLPREADVPSTPALSRDRKLSESRAALRDSVRKFLRVECPPSFVRKMYDDPRGTTDKVWAQVVELGLTAILVPEKYGGLDLGWAEMGVVLEEMGRAVHPGPFFSSAVSSVAALCAIGSADDQAAFLPSLASGERVATLALLDANREAEARKEGATFRIDGIKLVPDAVASDLLLVTARIGSELGLFAIEAKDAKISALGTLDGTRKQGEVVLSGAPARRIGSGDITARLESVIDRIRAATVIDAAGAADRALDVATEYAKMRKQFDRPIGSFQSLQHLLADMLSRLELARSGAYSALALADGSDEPAFHRAAIVAKAFASDGLYRVSADAIQVLGGMGFTWEHDAHLYYKRAMSMQHAFGGTPESEIEFAKLLLERR